MTTLNICYDGSDSCIRDLENVSAGIKVNGEPVAKASRKKLYHLGCLTLRSKSTGREEWQMIQEKVDNLKKFSEKVVVIVSCGAANNQEQLYKSWTNLQNWHKWIKVIPSESLTVLGVEIAEVNTYLYQENVKKFIEECARTEPKTAIDRLSEREKAETIKKVQEQLEKYNRFRSGTLSSEKLSLSMYNTSISLQRQGLTILDDLGLDASQKLIEENNNKNLVANYDFLITDLEKAVALLSNSKPPQKAVASQPTTKQLSPERIEGIKRGEKLLEESLKALEERQNKGLEFLKEFGSTPIINPEKNAQSYVANLKLILDDIEKVMSNLKKG